MEALHCWRLMAALAVLLLVYSSAVNAQERGRQQAISREPDVAPYLLVASVFNIHKMYPNGTGMQTIVSDSGISAVACHYRLDYIFWTNTIERTIKRARLNGTNKTTIVSGDIGNLVDLAVDWINDKLYWTDSDLRRIEEVDIVTLVRRVVVQMDTRSSPKGLAVYPLQDHGLLYWMDNIKHSLERIQTTGTSQVVLHDGLTCIWPLTLDYRQQMIYWTDYCQYSVESLYINGTNHEILVRGDINLVMFSYGITQFDDVIYWTQPMGVYMKRGSHVTQIYEGRSNQIIRDIQVVHPRSQPTAEELVQSRSEVISPCTVDCLNGGECAPPEQCACPEGWGGATCGEDVNECQTDNGGCGHVCSNTDGSFQCLCREGYTLALDGSTCIEPASPPITPSPSIENQPPTTFDPHPHPHPEPTLSSTGYIRTVDTTHHLPESRDSPSGIVHTAMVDAGMKAVSTQITLSHTFDQSLTSNPIESTNARVSSTTRVQVSSTAPTHGPSIDLLPSADVLPTTTAARFVHPPTTLDKHTLQVSDTTLKTSTAPVTRLTASSEVYQTPFPTTDAESHVPGINGVPPNIEGLDEGGEGSNLLVVVIPITVVTALVLISICAILLIAYYRKRDRRGSYSFPNHVAIDFAADVSSNTLKRGKVTDVSFRRIESTPDPPATIAILIPHQDSVTTSSSGLSGSNSFEWNNH